MQQPGLPKATARLTVLALGVCALLAFGGSAAFAQVTGKVIGTVTDRDTGQPLVGAQVTVEGTNLGNVTNQDGYYFVNNVPVGLQNIQAQYLGYQAAAQQQRILAGQTMTVDFALSSEVIQAAGIVATIEREPLVARDNTISKSRFQGEQVREIPVENLNEVVSLGAGIYQGQGGFIVRGGRGTEAATYVDGVLISDYRNQLNATDVSQYAVEEVDVVTGGFNAEFGHAQSGVINVVTREGGREFHGNVRYTTDGRYGTDGYDPNSDEPPSSLQKCCGYNNVQASVGGPIIPDKLSFFGSFEATGAADIDPRSGGFNPAEGRLNSDGSTESILPGNRGDRTKAQAKLTSFFTPTSKFTATYLYDRDQDENYQDGFNSANGIGMAQYLSYTAVKSKTNDIIVGYDQQLFQTAERNLNLQVRGNFHQTKRYQGLPKSQAMAQQIIDRIGADQCGAECDVSEYGFADDFLNYRTSDTEFFFEDSLPGHEPDLPAAKRDIPDAIFGTQNAFITEGITQSFDYDNELRYGMRVDLDSQLNRVHRAKAGVEWTWVNLSTRGPRYTDRVFADVYNVDPRIGAAYLQDRLDYGDLVIDLGLRWDHWDPNQVFPKYAGVVSCDITPFTDACTPAEDAPTVQAPTRDEFAPRLGVAHPITDATQVRLSYGKFYQLPRLEDFYSSFLTDFGAAGGNPNILYGNPNLDFIETTAFEAGITHLITENLVLDVVGYNRDRRGAIRVDVFQPGEIDPAVEERRIFLNGDNGNVKGFDITLNKRYSDYFSTDLAWSLQWARGTTSSPTEFATGNGFGRLFDPLFPGRLLVPPSELSPETFDRLHNINWQFNLRFPSDFREGTTMGQVFNDFSVYLVYNAQSGQPYTRRALTGQNEPLEDFGSSRLPWVHSGDIRVSKGFSLGDALHLDLFGVVQNFLDTKNILFVNPETGRPDLNGDEFTQSRNPQIPDRINGQSVFEEGATNAFPIQVTTIVPEFRTNFSKQDLNGDGTITLAEAQEALRLALIASGNTSVGFSGGGVGDSPYNYGSPRLFRFGAELRF